MDRSTTSWSPLSVALLALALVVLPVRALAGQPPAELCQTMGTGSHHDFDGQTDAAADCRMVCAASLPGSAAHLAEPASYVLRYRDIDTVRRGITLDPEHPPPR